MEYITLFSILEKPPSNISAGCNETLDTLFADLLDKEMYAVNMLDAWGKPEPGILYGSHDWLGSYDQCLEQSNATFTTEYYRIQVGVACLIVY